MDNIDRNILLEIQQDGRISINRLANKVGLSPTPCRRRLQLLEKAGYIDGYVARLNPQALGLNVTTFVHVRLIDHSEKTTLDFERAVKTMEQVSSCYTVSGGFDYILQVLTRDLQDYERWIKQLQRMAMVSHIDSSFAIRCVKNDPRIALT